MHTQRVHSPILGLRRSTRLRQDILGIWTSRGGCTCYVTGRNREKEEKEAGNVRVVGFMLKNMELVGLEEWKH